MRIQSKFRSRFKALLVNCSSQRIKDLIHTSGVFFLKLPDLRRRDGRKEEPVRDEKDGAKKPDTSTTVTLSRDTW